jgi:NAD(P)-dependent dehydrogenase (short-subunit alcohol dehydrogenase family)
MRLNDTVALITGGGSGIGQAIGELFAAEGASVVVVDRDEGRADATVRRIVAVGGVALAVVADVSRAGDVAAMAERALASCGRVDVLVNNATVTGGDDILTFDEATWDLHMAVELKAVFLCAKALLPQMIARRRGVILNIGSVNGLTGLGEEAYSAAKAGMINLTKNLAVKYGRHGLRANCICPGTVRTPIWQPVVERDPQIFEKLARWYPLGRVGEPSDIAKAALFLASDEAAWVSGATLVVDGGLSAGNVLMAQELDAGTPPVQPNVGGMRDEG